MNLLLYLTLKNSQMCSGTTQNSSKKSIKNFMLKIFEINYTP